MFGIDCKVLVIYMAVVIQVAPLRASVGIIFSDIAVGGATNDGHGSFKKPVLGNDM
jgi:hypothetical protein